MRVGEVPDHLCHPVFVRLTRDAGDLHGAGLQPHDEESDVADHSAPRRTSTVKKSAAARPSQSAARNVFQGVFVPRSGAGSMP